MEKKDDMESMMKELDIIKEIIKTEMERRGINIEDIILFGSRAKGNYKKDSDYDVYIIVDKKLSFKEMNEIITSIKWLLDLKSIPNDIIIRSKDDADYYKNFIGNISYYVNREGKSIWK